MNGLDDDEIYEDDWGDIYKIDRGPRKVQQQRAVPYGVRPGGTARTPRRDEMFESVEISPKRTIQRSEPVEKIVRVPIDAPVRVVAETPTVMPTAILQTPERPTVLTGGNRVPVNETARKRREDRDDRRQREPLVMEAKDIEMEEVNIGRQRRVDKERNAEIDARIRKRRSNSEERLEHQLQPGDLLRNMPQKIVMCAKRKDFDLDEFLDHVTVDDLKLRDLLQMSPYLRKLFASGLRPIPKHGRMAILKRHDVDDMFDDNLTDRSVGDTWILRYQKLDVSMTGTHRMSGKLGHMPMQGLIDGGSCVNVISLHAAQKANFMIHDRTTTMGFRQVDGSITNSAGELHDVIWELDEFVKIPISAVVLAKMDTNLILGRPFLEKTNATAQYGKGRWFLSWEGWVVIIQGDGREPHVVLKQVQTFEYYVAYWHS